MLEKLHAHGFRTLFNTDVTFQPLTILIGKNGVGKTAILDVVQLIGKFARGGAERAFGPPPWSLGWQRTRGIGRVSSTDFELVVRPPTNRHYRYFLKLNEQNQRVAVEEERVTRSDDNTVISKFDWGRTPRSGTVLRPDFDPPEIDELNLVAQTFRDFDTYELNPSQIEQPNDPKFTRVARNGFGVAGYLADLHDNDSEKFAKLESYLKRLRPETESLEVWSPGSENVWGIRDRNQDWKFPAVHLSWGERQLVGLLCVLFSAKPASTIAIEEIDRGFHPSRYADVIDLLSEAAYDGVMGGGGTQVIITTHSPSFVNKLDDLADSIRLVTRAAGGGTMVKPLEEALREKLGTNEPERPIGEIWEMGLLEETIHEAIT